MRETLSLLPAAWLSSSPIPIPHPASVLSAFKPGTVKVVRFIGPHRLYRAAGWDSTKGGMASAYGSWWADEMTLVKIGQRINMFEDWLPKEVLQKAWPAQYRGAMALCEDWNDMQEMVKLELPSRNEIIGLVGIAAPQPQKSSLDPNARKTTLLQGGAEQVFFKKT